MRMSRLFARTLRENPAEAAGEGYRLLLRGGFLRPLGAVGAHAGGVRAASHALLPLGARVLLRLDRRLEEALQALEAQPLLAPPRPSESLAAAAAALAGREVQSYRQLPQLLSQRVFRERDGAVAAEGLPGTRQPPLRESVVLAADGGQLRERTAAVEEACRSLLRDCALEALPAEADPGPGGGSAARLLVPFPDGPQRVLACGACGFRADSPLAAFRPLPLPGAEAAVETPRPARRVATPGAATIEELCRCLGVPASRTAKSVFLTALPAAGTAPDGAGRDRFVLAVVRGDRELSLPKLLRALGGAADEDEAEGGSGAAAAGFHAAALRPATEEEIRRQGIEPGYGSAVGLPAPGARGALVVADRGAVEAVNLVAGGNERGFHLLDVNAGRDWQPDLVADIAAAREGDGCPACGGTLAEVRGVSLVHTRLHDQRFSRAAGCLYQDPQGRYRPVRLATVTVDLGGLLACLAEAHRDGYGPLWPPAAAPFPLVLVDLCRDHGAADRLYTDLCAAGCEPLYDDRAESAGVKFADADLSGIPLRLTVGERSLRQGLVELKRRAEPQRIPVPLAEAVERVLQEVGPAG